MSDTDAAMPHRPATLEWEVLITVAGINFTSVTCDTKSEAIGLKNIVEQVDGVQNAEVQTA